MPKKPKSEGDLLQGTLDMLSSTLVLGPAHPTLEPAPAISAATTTTISGLRR